MLRTLADAEAPPRARREAARWLRPRLLAAREAPDEEVSPPSWRQAMAVMCAAHAQAEADRDTGLRAATAGPWLALDAILVGLAPEQPAGLRDRLAHAAWRRWQGAPADELEATRARLQTALDAWRRAPLETWPDALWLLDDAIGRATPAGSRRPLTATQRRRSALPPFGVAPGTRRPAPPSDGVLALYQPRLDVNLGVAVRSAEALGLAAVWLIGHDTLLSTVARGTDGVIATEHLRNGGALLERAAREGRAVVAVQQSPDAVSFATARYPDRPVFLLGAEDDGLPVALLERAALTVEIPLDGAVDSLNVATAATAVLAHWRHAAAGSRD
jgi:tRNA(Leu) C34 or U34 (ribose-2'-O)-methylase TrmL